MIRRTALGIVLAVLVAAAAGSAVGGSAVVEPKTVAVDGRVVGISADGGVVAAKTSVWRAMSICNSVVAWRAGGTRLTTFGKPQCKTRSSSARNVVNLTIAGGRVAWTDYEWGNHIDSGGITTATLANPKPHNVGLAQEPDTFYDFAGQGSLLVTREYSHCLEDCGPGESESHEHSITLYRVTGSYAEIGPLKDNTQLWDVDAGRLLLGRDERLEVVTPHQGKNALFITAGDFGRAFLSGNEVLAIDGTILTGYDATSGARTLRRRLPAGAAVADFSRGIALYRKKQTIHAVRLADGRDRKVATVPGLVAARLDASGLSYGYNVPGKGALRGRLAFIPFAALTRLLRGS